MSPSPLLYLPDKLTYAGIEYDAVDDWQTRGRGSVNFQGVLIHDTVGPTTGDHPSLNIVINGYPKLSGPLYNILIGRSGVVIIVGARLANHAGRGGPLAGIPENDGNEHLIGVSLENAGGVVKQPYTPEQLDVLPRLCTVLCDLIRVPHDRVWGHKEWTTRKIDPWNIDMDLLRALQTTGQGGPVNPELVERLEAVLERLGYTIDANGTLEEREVAAVENMEKGIRKPLDDEATGDPLETEHARRYRQIRAALGLV